MAVKSFSKLFLILSFETPLVSEVTHKTWRRASWLSPLDDSILSYFLYKVKDLF
jgi:hypothetical protein